MAEAITRRSFIRAAAPAGAASSLGTLGASHLVETDRAWAESGDEIKEVKTSCRACIASCTVIATVKNGRVVKLRGNPEGPISKGAMCAKGLSGIAALYHPNRLKYPMRRVGERGSNQWERLSWDEAVEYAARQLVEIYDKYGGNSLFCGGGGGGGPALNMIASRFADNFGSTNAFEPGGAQCFLPRGCVYDLAGMNSPSIADMGCPEAWREDTPMKLLLVWGTGPAWHSPAWSGQALCDLRERGVKTIVVDPRLTPDAARADVWLPLRAGTDPALALGWIHHIIESKLYDETFCLKWTNLPYLVNPDTKMLFKANELIEEGSEDDFVVWDNVSMSPIAWPYPWEEGDARIEGGDGSLEVELFCDKEYNGMTLKSAFQAYKDAAAEWTLEKTAEICWLEQDKLREAIELYATNSPAATTLGVSVEQNPNCGQSILGVLAIECICGNIGAGTFQNASGTVEKDWTTFRGRFFTGPDGKESSYDKFVDRLGNVEHKGLMCWGLCAAQELLDAIKTGEPYQPHAWVDWSGNKLFGLANAEEWYKALPKLDFVLHSTLYPTSFTVEAADIVFPCTEWLEANLCFGQLNQLDCVFGQRAVVHTFETLDYKITASLIAAKMAELGHERSQAFMEAGKNWFTTNEDYNNSMTAQYNMTWDEFCETLDKGVFKPDGDKKWVYDQHEAIGSDGKPNGFKTMTRKASPYLDVMTLLGRTGAPYSLPHVLPPSSIEYEPVPYFREQDEAPDDEYPFVISSGRLPLYHHNTLRNIPYLREICPVAPLWINPSSAKELGIADGDWVEITSRRATIKTQAHLTEGVHPRELYLERFWNPECFDEANDTFSGGWRECSINMLTKYDGYTSPEFSSYTLRGFSVRVAKASEPPAGVWCEPKQFEPWMPQPSDPTEDVV